MKLKIKYLISNQIFKNKNKKYALKKSKRKHFKVGLSKRNIDGIILSSQTGINSVFLKFTVTITSFFLSY